MRKTLIQLGAAFALGSVFVSPAAAQGYAGAVLSLSKVSDGCPLPEKCDDSGRGGKLYFGTRMAEPLLRLGAFKVAAMEVGLLRSSKARSQGVELVDIVDEGELPFAVRNTIKADALTFALVGSLPVADRLALDVKAGAAYVSSTIRYEFDGRSDGSRTRNRLSPYAGLALQYGVLSNVRVGAAVDVFRFNVAGESGVVSQLGFGAEVDF
ncbi:hypothetical protein GTZ97_07915 [Aquabacterium fontiphilum]|uniref:hypothetical protein n=1 Tax=Aquabacterium fontiphilum TaxID=450365 RepID=UPI0013773ADA|nr:hypothetical protein [Aquabacterium fontiphilum]NBD20590.1 hypothetical protein [Aquabacterium fontiphilum]